MSANQFPYNPRALFQEALQFLNRHDNEGAERIFRLMLGKNPNDIAPLTFLGSILLETGSVQEATKLLRKSLKIDPNQPIANNSLGAALLKIGQHSDARIYLEKAISLHPSFVEAHLNLGKVNFELCNFFESRVSYTRCIELDPNNAEAFFGRGLVFNKLNDVDNEFYDYMRSIKLKPDFSQAYVYCGNLHRKLKQYDAAIVCYERALNISPNLTHLHGVLMYMRLLICKWDDFDRCRDLILEKIRMDEAACDPFIFHSFSDSLELQLKCAQSFISAEYKRLNEELMSLPNKSKKIRLGYFSADFREHAVSYLMAGVFEMHDRSKFEIIGFDFGSNVDSVMRKRIKSGFDEFFDVSELTDEAAAKLSRELGVDIAINLGGYTDNHRTDIFYHRAAPLQISYIGFLGTMGTAFMDYLVADRVIVPESARKYYTEKIIYLPSFQANDSKRNIADIVFSRKELGLPETGFVFCCFNNNNKITPQIFELWTKILAAVEGSVLFLYAENDYVASNLKAEMVARNLDPDRLIFAGFALRPEYLARYRSMDLFLDTSPYNAGATASDALWAELPVLTKIGETFAARMCASLLTALELTELIVNSDDEYINLAIELATNQGKLSCIKRKLSKNRLITRLFNTAEFTKTLEEAFSGVYERHRSGLKPDHFYVEVS